MEFKIKQFDISLAVSGIVNVHFFSFEKEFETKSDKHPFAELVFVSSGKLFVRSEDFTGTLSRRDFIIHRTNALHSLHCTAGNAPTVIIIGFECESKDLERFFRAPVRLGDGDEKKLAEIVKEGRNVFAPPYNVPVYDMRKKKKRIFGAEQMLKNLLETFLIGLIRESRRKDGNAEKTRLPSVAATEIVSYIDDNFLEKITIDELAFLFRTNRSTLCKEFKKTTGKTLVGYINEKKLALAKTQISDTDKTFTEIAEEMNFESIHYFTRFFKKQTGITPKEYRAQTR